MVYIGKRSLRYLSLALPIGDALKTLDTIPQLIVASLATLVVAELSYRLVESPAMGMRKRLSAKQTRPPQPPPALAETTPAA